jgi:hypothetical protein
VNVNNTVVHNTYINKTVVNNVTVNNNSFNGPGGVTAKPGPQERAAEKEEHVQPTSDQISHRQVAVKDQSQFARNNNGHPATAAMNKVNGSRFTPEGNNARTFSRSNANNNPGKPRPSESTDHPVSNQPRLVNNQPRPVNQQRAITPHRQVPAQHHAAPRRERQR